MRTAAPFWSKVDRSAGPDSCWLWLNSVNSHGYGYLGGGGQRHRLAHRVAYELLVGPVPDGQELDHLCRTPRCVNPLHLEPVTHQENMLRGDNIVSRYAARTHCAEGHPFSGPNLRMGSRHGRRYRICLACRDQRNAARYSRGGER